jgi:hypothetical protein
MTKQPCRRGFLINWMGAFLAVCCAVGGAGTARAAAPTVTPQTPYEGVLRSPTRAALDAPGNLYVTDSRAGQVVKLSTNGTVLATRSGLSKPLGVAVGNLGRVYVGEEGTGRVLILDSTLTNTPAWLGAGTNEFSLPNHIAVDTTQSNGWIYVSDSRTNQVRCYSGTNLVKTIGSKGSDDGQFNFPAGLYVSPARELYVVDQNNSRVEVFNSTGAFQRAFMLLVSGDTGNGGRAQGITGNGSYLFVTDTFQNEVKVFDTAGNYQATIGDIGEWIGQLRTPGAAAIGADSRLFVASIDNRRIEIYSVQAPTVSSVTLQIVSLWGSPVPAAGLYTNVAGTTLTNTVALTDPRGTTQYVCTGWAMTGNTPLSGSSNMVVISHTNDAVLTWLWKTQYNLTVSAGSNGSVTVTNGWWDAGSSTVASATPDEFYSFNRWTGTATLVDNPLTLLMNGPYDLTALFAENVTSNGVPEWWLNSSGVTNGVDWNASSLSDDDHDGMPAWQEWEADTVPTNPLSFLGFSAIESSRTGSVLRWHGGSVVTQIVERAAQLSGGTTQWTPIFTNVPPTPLSTNLFDLSNTNTPYFYRIRVIR